MIGAGVIGAAITYELALRGVSVMLLECRGAGLGATQAAAGMLVPYLEGFGRPLLPLAARSLEMYDGFVDRVSRDAGVPIVYRRTGSLQAMMHGEPVEELEHMAAAARAAGLECELLDGNAARDAEPQLTAAASAALFMKSHGFVVPADLSGALGAAAIKHGATVRLPVRAQRITRHEGHLRVHADNQLPVTARHVVLAAGSWSGTIDIEGVPPLPVRPIRGQLLQLATGAPALNRILWGSRCYLVPASSTSILVGATVEDAGFDERTTVEGVRDLLVSASEMVPALSNATFVSARVGLRPSTPDEMPIIGRSNKMPGLVYATGHYRNGVLLAPLTARAVAGLILDNCDDPLLAPAAPERFGDY